MHLETQTAETLPEGVGALVEAIQSAGGVGALAARIDVPLSAPSMWRKRGRVPAEHCPAIERETGVLCERLRADVPWGVLLKRGASMAQVTQAEGANA